MSSNLVSANNLSIANNLTVNQNILGSGTIQTTGTIQGSNIVSTGNISSSNINFTGNLNAITLNTLSYLDPTSSIQTQLNTNSTNTSTNTANIASNTTNIATNTTNIATNTTNIATNTTNIRNLTTTVSNILSSSNSTNQTLANYIATNTSDIKLRKCELFTFSQVLTGDNAITFCYLNPTTSYGILNIVYLSGTQHTGLSFFHYGTHRININFEQLLINGIIGDVYTLDITCYHYSSLNTITRCMGMVGGAWCQNFAPGTWNTSGFINNQIQYLSTTMAPSGVGGKPYPNSGAFSFYIDVKDLSDIWVIAARQNQIGTIVSSSQCSVEFIG